MLLYRCGLVGASMLMQISGALGSRLRWTLVRSQLIRGTRVTSRWKWLRSPNIRLLTLLPRQRFVKCLTRL